MKKTKYKVWAEWLVKGCRTDGYILCETDDIAKAIRESENYLLDRYGEVSNEKLDEIPFAVCITEKVEQADGYKFILIYEIDLEGNLKCKRIEKPCGRKDTQCPDCSYNLTCKLKEAA